jgi:uncharacterized protein
MRLRLSAAEIFSSLVGWATGVAAALSSYCGARSLPRRQAPSDGPASAWASAPQTTAFNGGEGCWYDDGLIYFTTKGDDRVWRYDASCERIEVLYDAALYPDSPLHAVDNVTVARSGDVYVAEDGDNNQLCLITPNRRVSEFMQLEGHDGSEICGPAFNPAGDRLYFSSQRGRDGGGEGVTFEIRGPFRGR